MIDSAIWTLIGVGAIAIFFLLSVVLLPRRKTAEEKGKEALYEERCSVSWRYKWGIVAGGNIPVSRVSFYDDFFIVSFFKIKKILYSEVKSVIVRRNWLSNALSINLVGPSRTLVIYPRSADKMRQIIMDRTKG